MFSLWCIIIFKGKQRCFILHHNKATWQNASVFCIDHIVNGTTGRLAVDDTKQTHQILSNFFNGQGERAWLGATTAPFYWNWAPKQTCKWTSEL